MQSPMPRQKPETQDPKLIGWLVVPALLFVVIIALDLLPVLRGNDEWRWPLRLIESPVRILAPIGALGFYVFLSALWLRGFGRDNVSRKYERAFLLFVTCAAPIIQLALAFAVSRYPLLEFFGPTVSVHNSGYFTTAVATPDLNQLLANYASWMPQLPIHAQSHPPAPVVVQWLSWKFFQAAPPLADGLAMPLRTLQCHNVGLMALDNSQIASALTGMLLPLIGALAVWPLFAFARRLTTPHAAAVTVVLFPVLPLFAMWPSQWDQIYPLLLFSGLYFAHTGLEKQSPWRIFIAGVPLSVASFFSVGNFTLMVIVGLYGLAWLWIQRPGATSLRHAVTHSLRLAIIYALGCTSVWLIYAALYRVNPLGVISMGSRLAFESTTGQRSYGVWLIGNLIDFAIFLGAPIVLLLLYNLYARKPFPARLWPLTIATFGTLAALLVSGIVRGEVGRLWMYFGPLIVLISVAWSGERGVRGVTYPASSQCIPVGRNTLYVVLAALLALQLVVLNTRWLVNDSFLDEPPERSSMFEPPPMPNAAAVTFDRQIALRGYDVKTSGGAINLMLYWQALSQPLHAYTVFTHVFDVNGRPVGQQDNMPVHDQLPTSCWVPEEYVTDPYSIQLQEGARGPFRVEVGLYRGDTGARLSRDDAQGNSFTLEAP